MVAKDVADLHGAANNLTKQTALSEKGEVINGRGDTPNRHDILTGSQPTAPRSPAGDDTTCKNWTSSTQGAAMLGHDDRKACATMSRQSPGIPRIPRADLTAAAAQADLKTTGGDGLLYCFAAN